MEADINMFCMHMILMVFGKHDGGLIVGKEGDGLIKRDKNFFNKRTQPHNASFVVCVMATYLLSVVESETISCFLDAQDMVPPSIRKA